MLLFALMAAVAAWLLFVVTRYGLQRWWRPGLTAPAGRWSRLVATLLLLPAALVCLVVCSFGTIELLQSNRDHQLHDAYQAALHEKLARLHARIAGRYVLIGSALPAPNPNWYLKGDGWPQADSSLLALNRSNHGHRPHVELTLRDDGTFTYRSNIVGDATGQQIAGHWKLQPEYNELQTPEGVRQLHRYTFFFFGNPPDSVHYERLYGSLNAYSDITTVDLAGTFIIRSNSLVFKLQKEEASAAVKAL